MSQANPRNHPPSKCRTRVSGPAGTVAQTTEPTDEQRAFLGACKVPLPPRITALNPR